MEDRKRVLLQVRQFLSGQQNLYCAGLTWFSLNKRVPFQSENHLVHSGRRHLEVLLHIGLSWRETVDFAVVVDKG